MIESRVCRLGIPKWPMPFWLKSKILTWADPEREHPAHRTDTSSCMQEGQEEQIPLFYQISLQRLVIWTKWWHITARKLLLAFQKRYWGLLGNHLKTVTGVVNPHLAQVRLYYGRGRGRLLPQLSDIAPR